MNIIKKKRCSNCGYVGSSSCSNSGGGSGGGGSFCVIAVCEEEIIENDAVDRDIKIGV